jgi:hypothetical protein
MKVPAERLKQVLGVSQVNSVTGGRRLAIVDSPLERAPMTGEMMEGH